jgi:hypothetical protein
MRRVEGQGRQAVVDVDSGGSGGGVAARICGRAGVQESALGRVREFLVGKVARK